MTCSPHWCVLRTDLGNPGTVKHFHVPMKKKKRTLQVPPTWPPHHSLACRHPVLDTIFLKHSTHVTRTFYGTSPFPPCQPQVPCLALEACYKLAFTYLPTYCCSLLPRQPAGLQPSHVTPVPEARLCFPSLSTQFPPSNVPFSPTFSDSPPLSPRPGAGMAPPGRCICLFPCGE